MSGSFEDLVQSWEANKPSSFGGGDLDVVFFSAPCISRLFSVSLR